MTEITDLISGSSRDIETLTKALQVPASEMPCQEALTFCYELSSVIQAHTEARASPSLQALGFWLRKTSLSKLIEQNSPQPAQTKRLPRGTVFQIPPRNVDVLFGYHAMLSLICGNRTIVRLWKDMTEEQACLLQIIKELLPHHKAVAQRLFLLSYGRDDKITSELSMLCNTRMVWGGDHTINHIRALPRPALSNEVGFADRFSSALLSAESWNAASDEEKQKLLTFFARDMLSFNQMACSSPRLIIWHGNEDNHKTASENFYKKLSALTLDKFGRPDIGGSVKRKSNEFLALHDLDIKEKIECGETLTILRLGSMDGFNSFKDVPYGDGMLFDYRIDNLKALSQTGSPKDQTLIHWGFSKNEVKNLAIATNNYDRYVPVGQALDFDPIWDGINLFEVMTKLTKVIS